MLQTLLKFLKSSWGQAIVAVVGDRLKAWVVKKASARAMAKADKLTWVADAGEGILRRIEALRRQYGVNPPPKVQGVIKDLERQLQELRQVVVSVG